MLPPRNDNAPRPGPDTVVTRLLLCLIAAPLALGALSAAAILWHVSQLAR